MNETPDQNTETDLHRIVNAALAEARDQGLDYTGQTERAVRAVLAVRPDMTAGRALSVVRRMQRLRVALFVGMGLAIVVLYYLLFGGWPIYCCI